MWKKQVQMGCVPYYMFIPRDTGAAHYFQRPLARIYECFADAYKNISGLARTVRGPSMTITAGKVGIIGVEEIAGEKVFVFKFFQARNPEWVRRFFYAKYDPEATWIDKLVPAFGAKEYFFEKEMHERYPNFTKIS
jgi:hypothetical protein